MELNICVNITPEQVPIFLEIFEKEIYGKGIDFFCSKIKHSLKVSSEDLTTVQFLSLSKKLETVNGTNYIKGNFKNEKVNIDNADLIRYYFEVDKKALNLNVIVLKFKDKIKLNQILDFIELESAV